MVDEETARSARLHYGWIVAAVTFAALLAAAGIRATPGVLMVPFENEFGWSSATISFAGAVSLTSLMRTSWQLVLLWGILVGAGSGMVALAVSATIVNQWFAERRGLVLGVLTASTATGQLVFLPALAAIIEAFGWRAAVLAVAGVGFLTLPLIGCFMLDRPADLGLLPYGQTGGSASTLSRKGNPFVAALEALGTGARSKDFWLLSISFFI